MKYFLSTLLMVATTTLVADPYLWLEEETQKTQEWVEQERTKSESYFQKLDTEELEAELRALSDQEMWGLPQERNGVLYFTKRGEGENRAVLVRKEGDAMEVLVDPNTFAREVMLAGFNVSKDGSYVAYALSIGGSDQREWHILDLKSGDHLPEVLTEIRFTLLLWDDFGETVYYIKNKSEVYAHTLGRPIEEDALLYKSENGFFLYHPHVACDSRYLVVEERKQVVKEVRVRLIDIESHRSYELKAPGDFGLQVVGSLSHEILAISDEGASMGKLIALSPNKVERTVIEESESLLHQVEVVGDKLACVYYEHGAAAIKLFDLEGNFLYALDLPDKGSATIAASGDTLFYSYTNFYTPPHIYRHKETTEPLHTPEVAQHPIVTKQVEYTSEDGTRVPLFITHRADLEIGESTPILLNGYGGFAISRTPAFRPYQLSWIERGGVFALACIRGGKELGVPWYEGGARRNKQNCFDDFISAAEWLRENLGGPIGIFGTSNGGLLTGAVVTQRPELFDAVVVNKGLLDMARFHLFTVGHLWIGEYGDPDDPDDYAYLMSYSPYHNVKEGTHYPATLVNTATHDDRVVPLHSYKFYAALKEANVSQNPILLRLEWACGHGGNNSREQEVAFGRDMLAFLYKELAWRKATPTSKGDDT